jgi:hypothetical protein
MIDIKLCEDLHVDIRPTDLANFDF